MNGPDSGSDFGSSQDARPQLHGWKDIASYFGRSVRTVQRWERDFGLPVRRYGMGRAELVHAYLDDLEHWKASAEAQAARRVGGADEDLPAAPAPPPPPPARSRLPLAVTLTTALLVIVTIVGWIVIGGRGRPSGPTGVTNGSPTSGASGGPAGVTNGSPTGGPVSSTICIRRPSLLCRRAGGTRWALAAWLSSSA